MARHPKWVTSEAIVGRKTSWPAALAAVSRPTTKPSRARNQRPAIYAARNPPTKPVDNPTTTPHNNTSCHGWLIAGVTTTLTAVVASASVIVRRAPKRSITAAAKGPIAPKSREVDPKGEGDRRPRPMELVFERHDQHAGCRTDACGHDRYGEADRDDDPGIMRPAQRWANP